MRRRRRRKVVNNRTLIFPRTDNLDLDSLLAIVVHEVVLVLILVIGHHPLRLVYLLIRIIRDPLLGLLRIPDAVVDHDLKLRLYPLLPLLESTLASPGKPRNQPNPLPLSMANR